MENKWNKPQADRLNKGLEILMGLVATGILCVFVYFLDIQNPNVATFTIVVFLTFSFGFYVGVPSAALVLLYSLFFFSKNRSFPFTYTVENVNKIIVAVIFLVIIVLMVGYLKRETDRKNRELQEKNQELAEANEKLEEANQKLQVANGKLEELSLTDSLTGIANRRAFDQTYNYEFAAAVRNQLPLSFLMLDLDFFKQYNDLYGHLAGDECLKKIAGVLCRQLKRRTDLVARYGGEEFIVLLPNTEVEEASRIADYIQTGLHQMQIPFSGSSIAEYVTASIGITSLRPRRDMDPREVIDQADKALYAAKNKGRNCVIVYQEA